MKRTPIKRRGAKTRTWDKVRAELKQELVRKGIEWCEVGFTDCTGKLALSFAHSRKRRNITTDAGLREACLACLTCHAKLELMREDDMAAIVINRISSR